MAVADVDKRTGGSMPGVIGWVPRKIAEARSFLTEVRTELKKVTWPARKETVASTVVVIVIVLVACVYLGIVDMILSRLIRFILY